MSEKAPVITFAGKPYPMRPDETVLDGLERGGAKVPNSCRSGICQSCLMHAVVGTPPSEAQIGLSERERERGFFLACICRPQEDLSIILPSDDEPPYRATVTAKEWLVGNVLRLRLARPAGFDYKPGQFINLRRRGSDVVRSYSLASIGSDTFLELHIRRIPDGSMTSWIFDVLEPGDSLDFYGPFGECFYQAESLDQPLLLAGTGTGLAPLLGILRDAFARGHRGPIHLLHGGLSVEGLYLIEAMQELAAAHPQMRYTPCVLRGDAPAGGAVGSIDRALTEVVGALNGWSCYLCGDPGIVEKLRVECFMHGADFLDVHADAFAPSVKP